MTRLTIVLSILTSLFAGAAMAETPITRIEDADLVCSSKGAAYFVDTRKERVWQGERGQDEGLELRIKKFERQRCKDCYRISAELETFGTTMAIHLSTATEYGRGGARKLVMTVILDELDSEALKLTCNR